MLFTPQGKQPWDDAVTLVLTYAEIPYDEIYDKEVIENQLLNMSGFIYTMKILLANMGNSIEITRTLRGTKNNNLIQNKEHFHWGLKRYLI